MICWGSAVRKRFPGDSRRVGWFQNFEVVRLWGRFAILGAQPGQKAHEAVCIVRETPFLLLLHPK